jgi:hypothetical protein
MKDLPTVIQEKRVRQQALQAEMRRLESEIEALSTALRILSAESDGEMARNVPMPMAATVSTPPPLRKAFP